MRGNLAVICAMDFTRFSPQPIPLPQPPAPTGGCGEEQGAGKRNVYPEILCISSGGTFNNLSVPSMIRLKIGPVT